MKLSTRDKQRLQWGGLILVCGTAILYAYINVLIIPFIDSRAEGKKQLEECTAKIAEATNALCKLSAVSNEVARLQAEISVATNQFVIRPVLGSTLVSVQRVIEPMALACGLQLESCVELGRMDVPVNKKDAGFVIDRDLVALTAIGSYDAVRDFVQTLEETHEYVCVTEVEVVGRGENVQKHKLRICTEWPVWGERKADAASANGRAAAAAEEDR